MGSKLPFGRLRGRHSVLRVLLPMAAVTSSCRHEEGAVSVQSGPPGGHWLVPRPGAPLVGPASHVDSRGRVDQGPPSNVGVSHPESKASRPLWAVANEDPRDDGLVGPPAEIPDCLAKLAALGVRAKPTTKPVHQEGSKTCGAPQVLVYESGPSGAKWSSPPEVTCLVALGLSRFEHIAMEEAARHFSSAVKRITHLGTYSCRPMVRFNLASEHSYANAIDISGLELQNGTKVSIDPDWAAVDAPPNTPASRFLRTVARRAYDEGAFSVVLGPPWDSLHKNHLHLDQARYRVSGLDVRR